MARPAPTPWVTELAISSPKVYSRTPLARFAFRLPSDADAFAMPFKGEAVVLPRVSSIVRALLSRELCAMIAHDRPRGAQAPTGVRISTVSRNRDAFLAAGALQ